MRLRMLASGSALGPMSKTPCDTVAWPFSLVGIAVKTLTGGADNAFAESRRILFAFLRFRDILTSSVFCPGPARASRKLAQRLGEVHIVRPKMPLLG